MPQQRSRRLTSSLLSLLLAAATAAVLPLAAPAPAVAAEAPALAASPDTVSADALPTVQINGVVWDQVIVGNTVFVGGEFTNARPAGAAPGVNTTPRTHLLAYDIRTGELITSFNPVIEGGKVDDLAVSPDGTKLGVVGNFTRVNGVNRFRTAVFNLPSGTLSNVSASLDAPANSVAMSNTTMYVGGYFSRIGNTPRSRVGAIDLSTAAVRPFSVAVDNRQVLGLVLSPDNSQILLAGSFTSVGGASNPGFGLYRADATTGAGLPLPLNTNVRNAGDNSAILKVDADQSSFYGVGYHFGRGGSTEGAFQGSWSDGSLVNIEDCHGDTYDIAPMGDVVYQASHKHYCGNSGGFPQTEPWTFWHSTAWSKETRGTNTADIYGYPDWPGSPRPDLLPWFPHTDIGTYTGKNQATWSVKTNDKYVVMGGEFPRVNGQPQQGLVRYTVKSQAPNKEGPRPTARDGSWAPSVQSFRRGQVKLTWPTLWDRDDTDLTYRVWRQTTGNVVHEVASSNTQWDVDVLTFTDTSVAPGTSTRYWVQVSDPDGNTYGSGWLPVTVAETDLVSQHGATVLDDGATKYWPLNEPAGSTVVSDFAGSDNTTSGAGVTRGINGAMTNSADRASQFNGTTEGRVYGQQATAAPNTFSQQVWFRTTTTAGGKIAGFGNSNTGNSGSYDRHLYMEADGRVVFGVYPGAVRTVSSAPGLNDGNWHQAVTTLGPDGMSLYIDGKRVARRTDTTTGQAYTGYWRIGGDNLGGWTSGNAFNGAIDDYSIFPTVLTPRQVDAHWQASGRASALPPAPSDALGAAMHASDPELYWRLEETSGTTAADSALGANPGTYFGRYTRGRSGVTAESRAVALDARTSNTANLRAGNVVATTPVVNPTTFSQQVWVKTTTQRGGRIFGFGSSANGVASTNYDRQLYMLDDGRVRFGVYNGSTVTIDSTSPLNDGAWHQVVSTFDQSGMKLYVDGELQASDSNSAAQNYTGYWKLGSDNTWGGHSDTTQFIGEVDEAAIYPRALSASEIRTHFRAGGGQVPNQPPTAAFTASTNALDANFDASGSTDPEGEPLSYSWQFGDGQTATGVRPSHRYAESGTYTVRLTVTDAQGATASSESTVSVQAPNVDPTAAFTSATDGLTASFDARGSSDPDGTIVSYDWDFGDGSEPGTGVAPNHTYSAGGTFAVRLTVTDDRGATASSTRQVTVEGPNQAPSAAFTVVGSGLGVSVDGSGSADADGSIVSYAWNWGDGSAAGSGRTATHTYASAGEKTVTLTVTDNRGATATTTRTVTLTAPAPDPDPDPEPVGVLAQDGFDRSVTGGWGSAETGGAWSVGGGNARFSVGSSAGSVLVPSGQTLRADLNAVSVTDSVVSTEFSVDKLAEGQYVGLRGRGMGANSYNTRLVISGDGSFRMWILRNDNAQVGSVVNLPFKVVPGQKYSVKMSVSGTAPTTLAAKVWPSAEPEPAEWQRQGTDNTAGFQVAGSPGIYTWIPNASAAAAPVRLSFDSFRATAR